MSPKTIAIAAAIAIYLLTSTLLPPSPGSSRPSPGSAPGGARTGVQVVGYYLDDASYESMVANAGRLTAIAPWAWSVDASGNVLPATDPTVLGRTLQAAGARGLETYAMVHNYLGDTFDGRAVHTLLSNPAARQKAIEQIAAQARRYGLTGVNLDFENVPPDDREALSSFVKELARRLHRDGRKLTISVPAKTSDSPSNSHSGAFDYAALGRYADSVWLMTYDEHYRTGPPGPVASIEWVEQVVRHAVSQIPSRKVLLGLPAYGYEWVNGGEGRGLTHAQAVARLSRYGAILRWHPVYKVPYFTAQGRQVWFENRYSTGYKLQLVGRYDLGGVTIWRLGQEDPGIWEVIGRSR